MNEADVEDAIYWQFRDYGCSHKVAKGIAKALIVWIYESERCSLCEDEVKQ